MNNLIQDLIKKGMGNFMDRSRDALIWGDEIYLNDLNDENELEQRYEKLDQGAEKGNKRLYGMRNDSQSPLRRHFVHVRHQGYGQHACFPGADKGC